MRGVIGKSLNPEVILKFTEAFGSWLIDKVGEKPKVLVGMDPRTTGPMIKKIAIGALQSVGAEVLDTCLCPTPALLFGHKNMDCDGTVIISASHNPPQYNGMKCLGPHGTYLGDEDLKEINSYFYGEKEPKHVKWDEYIPVFQVKNLVEQYFIDMKKYLDMDVFKAQNERKRKKLKVIVDTGCGAGSGVTASFLTELGCNAIEINNERQEDGSYPRMFEPTIEHLSILTEKIDEIGCDVAFAHDFDADRVTLIGERGQIYREDVILALIWKHILEKGKRENVDSIKLVTNCASSLMLDDLAEKYGATIEHTPVGERNLAVKLNQIKDTTKEGKNTLIFGGEGSCGGFMYPEFNNTRDGIFAAVMICEILLSTGKTITELVEEIPSYHSTRKNVKLEGVSAMEIMNPLKEHLDKNSIPYETIHNDVKVFGKDEWTLVHPSNTEPIIRIITEAKTEERTEELVKEMDQTISNL